MGDAIEMGRGGLEMSLASIVLGHSEYYIHQILINCSNFYFSIAFNDSDDRGNLFNPT